MTFYMTKIPLYMTDYISEPKTMTFFRMFFVFSNFVASRLESRSLCAINIEGNTYNINALQSGVQNFTYEGFTYYFKLCGSLKISDVPGAAEDDIVGANIMRTNGSVIQSVNYLAQFDFNEIPEGVTYTGDGEPFLDDGIYRSVDFDFYIKCDGSTSDNFNYIPQYDEATNTLQFRVNYKNKAGCMGSAPKPTPTPTFNPICNFASRMDHDENLGINAHFGEVDGGPYGIRSTIKVNGKKHAFYYKPCGRMECPPENTCESNEYSSAFICPLDPAGGDCQSFGVQLHDKSAISLYGNKENEGLLITYGNDHQSKVHITSVMAEYPEGHITFDSEAELKDNVMFIKAFSHEADVEFMPVPDPGAPKCQLNITKDNVKLEVNLKNLNGDENGHEKVVNVEGMVGISNATIFYQPCAAMACPQYATCRGVEDSTVYFCPKDSECISYGIYENEINFTLTDQSDLNKGFSVSYIGQRRAASVKYICDPSVGVNDVRIGDTVRLNGTKLYMEVATSNACTSKPTPQPTPEPWVLPTPNRLEPAPSPMKSPNPTNVIQNETHYMPLDLNFFNQDIYLDNTKIKSRSNTADFHVEFKPWDIIYCPDNFGKCPIGRATANAYGCSKDKDGLMYCYPYGNKIYDAEASLYNTKMEDGVQIIYNSEWDRKFKLVLECDPKAGYNTLQFEEGRFADLEESGFGNFIVVYAKSANACPRQFRENVLPPTPQPTPEPTPLPAFNFYYTSGVAIGNLLIEINLSKVKVHDEHVVLRSEPNFIKAEIQIDPDEPRSCVGDVCVGGGKTNIWKCLTIDGVKKCYGIGDARQKLEFWADKKELNAGISVTYGGGYDGYYTTINYVCNSSIPGDQIDFDDMGFEDNKHVTLSAHTAMVCPHKLGPTPLPTPPVEPTPTPYVPSGKKISGGAVFLIIVFVSCTLYFGGGLIYNYFVKGEIKLFNQEFWASFWDYLHSGATFVFTCGRHSARAAAKYDAI